MKWVLKTSTLRVATREKDRTYRSIDDVPRELQTKIRATLHGPNSETIFLANQEAYDRIATIARELSPEMRPFGRTGPAFTRGSGPRRIPGVILVGIGISALTAASLIWVFLSRSGIP